MSPHPSPLPAGEGADPHPDPLPGGEGAGRDVRRRLLDLAQDASSYLRHHRRPAVRASAALLLATSLAACGPEPSADEGDEAALVEPLAQEVRSGLPNRPGRYPVDPESLVRDQQGVYSFDWQEAGAPAGQPAGQTASASLVQLAQGDRHELEIPAVGDPILYLPAAAAIPIVASALVPGLPQAGPAMLTPTPGVRSGSSGSSRTHISTWYPWSVSDSNPGPAYRDPPTDTRPGDTVRGANVATRPRPAAERVAGLSHGVSGQAGGTGRGTAATFKSGSSASSGPGPATTKSSGFSGGGGGASFSGGG